MGWMLFLTSYDSKKNERRLHGDSYVQRSEKVIITQGKTIIKTPQGGKKGKKKKKRDLQRKLCHSEQRFFNFLKTLKNLGNTRTHGLFSQEMGL